MSSWKSGLLQAARQAKQPFHGVESIDNEAHGIAASVVLKAFGGHAACSVFAEPRTPDRGEGENARPADLFVLHPDLGVVFIEVKGWVLSEIEEVVGGTVYRRVHGVSKSHDPWHQASRAVEQLQRATKNVIRRRGLSERELPYFHWFSAFPNMSRADWIFKGFGRSLDLKEVLFSEDLAESDQLRTLMLRRARSRAGYRLPFSPAQLDHVREALGSSAVINRRKRSTQAKVGKLSERINEAEVSGKRFSSEQLKLIEADFDGRPQLVRGVAGSGKTSVLLKNFATMVARHCSGQQSMFESASLKKRFAIVCYNQSLVPLLVQGFKDAYTEITHRAAPPCVDIHYFNGFMWMLHQRSRSAFAYQFWRSAKQDKLVSQRFAKTYCDQIDRIEVENPRLFEELRYDSIFVDEGQDLYEEEYLVLMKLLRPDPKSGEKNLVIFYDDAQNLYGRQRPNWAKLGIDVTRGRATVMKTCYRNPKQIVEFAFNVLLGAAAETRVLTKGFADTEYLTKEPKLIEGLDDRGLVHFAPRTDGIAPEVNLFATRAEELDWLFKQLERLLGEEAVAPDDILIVAQEPWHYETLLEGKVRQRFPQVQRILKPYGPGDKPDKKVYILQNGTLTLASIGAAKGYDCPIVLLVGADLFPSSVEGRASFYVAATRAKMRLYVTGLREPGSLAEEAEKVSALLATPAKATEEVSVSASPTQLSGKTGSGPVPNVGIPEKVEVAAAPPERKFIPAFRKGDLVLQTMPVRRQGIVESDAVQDRKITAKFGDQVVQVKFPEGTFKVALSNSKLERLQTPATVP